LTIGAIDSTHIACHPSAQDRNATHDHKGNFSQNCLAACSFNLCFTYMRSGWEGSAADARVYHDARTTDFTSGKRDFAIFGFMYK
jgi:hypothetical protein